MLQRFVQSKKTLERLIN